ncbi:Uncharacterised protein [uncultured archaeon]|nr:Uncharacterised protein [uncultured archaeon]
MKRVRKGGVLTLRGFAPRAATNAQLGKRIENLLPKSFWRIREKKVLTKKEASALHCKFRARYKRKANESKAILDKTITKIYREFGGKQITLDTLRLACEASPVMTSVLKKHEIPYDSLILRLTTLFRKGSFPTIIRKGRAVIKRKKADANKVNVGIPEAELIKSPWYVVNRQEGIKSMLDAYEKEVSFLRQLEYQKQLAKKGAVANGLLELIEAQGKYSKENLKIIAAIVMKRGTPTDKSRMQAKIKELGMTK